MRRLFYYMTALLTLWACNSMLEEKENKGMDPSLEGKPVTITFSLPDVALLSPSTKSLTEEGDIGPTPYLDPDKLYLVVCGETQSIKYIRKAEVNRDPVSGNPILEKVSVNDIEDYPLDDYLPTDEVDLYTFTVQLELSDRPRTIHFLGNIDENQLITGSYSYQVLPTLLSYENKQAYWQKVYVENIHADPDIPPVNGSYSPDTYITNRLKYVPLIRNYAKIQVIDCTEKKDIDDDEQFELYSYAVIHYPQKGSVVPYRFNAGENEDPFSFNANGDSRLSGYEKCNFETLKGIGYDGHLPLGVTFNDYIPTKAQFENPDDITVIRYDENNPHKGFYVYERNTPTTTMTPTFVIIRGRFGSEGDYYYYRLDLMETTTVNNEPIAQYYPIYRNFRYNIELSRISSQGLPDPWSAANSTGAVDISADISMRHLSDISNGQTRLVVEPFMARTYTGPSEEGCYYLYARFFNNLISDIPNEEWGAVTVELEQIGDQIDDILVLYDDQGHEVHGGGFFYPTAQTIGGVRGFRVIRFNTKEPGENTLTQKIKITGRMRGVYEEFPLYREVEISLQSKQLMTVTCNKPVLACMTGSKQVVSVSIPAGLPDSMFPLDFIIEAEDMTLTPDNKEDGNNLPVRTGISISDNEGYAEKTTFQFIRTLTLDEYISNTSGNTSTFNCYFKSNRPVSATTIWVDNEYFYKKSVSFINEAEKEGHFYIEADETCYVRIDIGNLDYKLAGGGWNSYTKNSTISLEPTQRVYFRSNKNTDYSKAKFRCSSKSNMSTTDGKFHVGGDISSLLAGDDFDTDGPSCTNFTFVDFFKNHTGLSDASDLVLPMRTLKGSCYKSMFQGCTNLSKGPKRLPATTLADACYRNMFRDCVKLVNAPVLVSEKLANNCYQMMFVGCTSLQTIKLNSKTYNYSTFFGTNTSMGDKNEPWYYGVPAGGTIWLNPAIKGSSGHWNVVPQSGEDWVWTVKIYNDDGNDDNDEDWENSEDWK